MDPATSKFLHARPYAVLSAAPSLAAIYASANPSKNTDWCTKCGSYLFDGSGQVRVVRLKSQKQKLADTKILRTTCTNCGWKTDVSRAKPPAVTTVSQKESSPNPSPRPPSTTNSYTCVQSKVRDKKKSALQSLLSEKRDREAQGKLKSRDIGLAAFLNDL